MLFLAGLVLGLTGSGHCAVMCGPLVGTFGRRADLAARLSVRHTATYHAGRLAMYLIGGTAAGLSGHSVAAFGFSRLVAVSLGAALIAGAVRGKETAAVGYALWARFGVPMTVRAAGWSRRHPCAGPALMGAVNGMLPCGLLYAALVAAAGLGQARDALMFIGGFGLGTVPALAVFGAAAAWVPSLTRYRWRGTGPLVLVSIGLLLIARGVTGGHSRHVSVTMRQIQTVAAPHAHLP